MRKKLIHGLHVIHFSLSRVTTANYLLSFNSIYCFLSTSTHLWFIASSQCNNKCTKVTDIASEKFMLCYVNDFYSAMTLCINLHNCSVLLFWISYD